MTGDAVLTIRDLLDTDIPFIVSYLYESHDDFLRNMGIDKSRLPHPDSLKNDLIRNAALPDNEKINCVLIWDYQNSPIGFSTLKRIKNGHSADIHLHIWNPSYRGRGFGTYLFAKSLQMFFERFNLQEIYCEPARGNQASNGVLQKLGFSVSKSYRTIPSEICYEIEVNRYVIARDEMGQAIGLRANPSTANDDNVEVSARSSS